MIIYIVLLQLFARLDESTVQRFTQASRGVGVTNTSIHGIVCKSHQTAQRGQETDCEPVMMEENELTAEEHDESMDENVLGENESHDENEEEENESESEDWSVSESEDWNESDSEDWNESESEDWNESESEDWNESESVDKDFDEEVGSVTSLSFLIVYCTTADYL